jgi:hypothetical protein
MKKKPLLAMIRMVITSVNSLLESLYKAVERDLDDH